MNNTTVVWHFELIVTWDSCTQQLAHPLVGVRPVAKVSVTVSHGEPVSCMTGGVELILDDDSNSKDQDGAFLPWDASEAAATALVNSLVAPHVVVVDRRGDGWSEVVFHITTITPGDVAPLKLRRSRLFRAVPSSQLMQDLRHRIKAADDNVQTLAMDTLVQDTLQEHANATHSASNDTYARIDTRPGGIELMPLPGRYLTAASDAAVVSVRIKGQTTALCAAPDWGLLAIGCFERGNLSAFTQLAVTPAWDASGGLSLERCSIACRGSGAFGVQRAECICLASAPTHGNGSFVGSGCHASCPGDPNQICGGVDLIPVNSSAVSVYRTSMSLDNPCSFNFTAAATPQLTGTFTHTLAEH